MTLPNTLKPTDSTQPLLVATGIHKNYGPLAVLKGVNLEVHPGEAVALLGASGAGKSTLLQIVGTLDTPDQGQVLYNGEDLTRLSTNALAKLRNRHLGFVFQFHYLLPEFTALENAAMPAYLQGLPKKDAEARATELLTTLGLAERLHHKPTELSGGEQQRTAVARALVNGPSLLLADEPTGNLDTPNGERLMNLLLQLAAERGLGVLIATHNEEFAARCHRQVRIQDGLIKA